MCWCKPLTNLEKGLLDHFTVMYVFHIFNFVLITGDLCLTISMENLSPVQNR